MDITTLKTRAAELAALGTAMTAEQAEELRTVSTQIEEINAKAVLAARAVELVNTGDIVERAADEDTATPGAAFVRSASFKNYAGKGTSEAFETNVDVRSFVALSDLNIVPSRTAVATAVAPLPLTGVVGGQNVSGNAVEWVVESFDSQAAATAEGDAAPESLYSTSVETVTLEKINHYTQISEEAAEDAGSVQNTVDGKLRRGLAQKIEANIGAAIVAGTYATSTEATLIAAIRKAQAQVEATGFTPRTVLLNPADLADLDISFLAVNKGAVRGDVFWGLNAVASSAVAAGTAYVGDFASGVTLFTRNSVRTVMSDSHEGNFIKGIITLLAGLRAKAVVTNAAAIAKAIVD